MKRNRNGGRGEGAGGNNGGGSLEEECVDSDLSHWVEAGNPLQRPSPQSHDPKSDEELSLIDAQPAASTCKHAANMEDYTGLATPDQCVADFCIVPVRIEHHFQLSSTQFV